MIRDVARPEHHEPPSGDAAKQLQQAAIAGSVDAGRPRDDELDVPARRRVAADRFPLELRSLVVVTGPERGILVGRRMFDVAVDADRAAVHETTYAGVCANVRPGFLPPRH